MITLASVTLPDDLQWVEFPYWVTEGGTRYANLENCDIIFWDSRAGRRITLKSGENFGFVDLDLVNQIKSLIISKPDKMRLVIHDVYDGFVRFAFEEYPFFEVELVFPHKLKGPFRLTLKLVSL